MKVKSDISVDGTLVVGHPPPTPDGVSQTQLAGITTFGNGGLTQVDQNGNPQGAIIYQMHMIAEIFG